MLWYPLAFLLALGILVTVHELGHYFAARMCGIKVLKFSIGFGRTLWSKTVGRDATEWVIALVPLGGYVKMLDEREGAVPPQQLERAFNRQPLSRRAFVVVAGPLANLALAVAIYWIMFMVGVQELKPMLGQPPVDSPAAVAGVTEGDWVRSVDGVDVRTWSELRMALLEAHMAGRSAELRVTQGENARPVVLPTDSLGAKDLDGDMLRKLGLLLNQPKIDPVIGKVQAGSPAQKAGLQPGDRIVAIGSEPVSHWGEVVDKVRAAPGKLVSIDVVRLGHPARVELVPDTISSNGKAIGRMGAAVQAGDDHSLLIELRYGPAQALGQAFKQTWATMRLSLSMMGRMVTGDISWRNLSGPVTIADYAGQTAQMGLMPYVSFIAMISISLGVLNLLPVPLLDGGHLMYYLAEFFKGSPVSERAMDIGQRIGFGVLGLLMACALFNDLNRLFFG